MHRQKYPALAGEWPAMATTNESSSRKRRSIREIGIRMAMGRAGSIFCFNSWSNPRCSASWAEWPASFWASPPPGCCQSSRAGRQSCRRRRSRAASPWPPPSACSSDGIPRARPPNSTQSRRYATSERHYAETGFAAREQKSGRTALPATDARARGLLISRGVGGGTLFTASGIGVPHAFDVRAVVRIAVGSHDQCLPLRIESAGGTLRAFWANGVATVFQLLGEIVLPGRHSG